MRGRARMRGCGRCHRQRGGEHGAQPERAAPRRQAFAVRRLRRRRAPRADRRAARGAREPHGGAADKGRAPAERRYAPQDRRSGRADTAAFSRWPTCQRLSTFFQRKGAHGGGCAKRARPGEGKGGPPPLPSRTAKPAFLSFLGLRSGADRRSGRGRVYARTRRRGLV